MEIVDRLKEIKIKIDEKDILNVLKIRKRWPVKLSFYDKPGLEMIDEYGLNMWHELYSHDGYLNYFKFLDRYEKGFTFLLSNILDIHGDLRKVEGMLSEIIGHSCWANLYFAKGGKGRKPSFDLHKHPYDVVIKQIYGTSPWIVGEEYIKLKPGHVLFIPANTNHQVTATDEKKLSLTINLT